MKHKRGFDQTGNPSRLFRMPNIRFNRTSNTVLVSLGLLPKRHAQRFDLQRVADYGTGRVTFDIANAVCV